jgi:ureidoacrylate peracid hydrolase
MSTSTRPDWIGWRNGILAKVEPRQTAVAVIDIQRDFCCADGALARLGSDVSPSRAAADAIAHFLPRIRPLVAFVAFFRLVYDPSRMSGVQQERLLRDGRPIICAPDSRGSELVIEPAENDKVFTKHRYSAFSSPEFRDALRLQSIDTIAVVGVDTHICVEGTVREGYDLGYRMLVLADLVATRSSELARHESSLAICERYFGLVVESKVLLETLQSRSAL